MGNIHWSDADIEKTTSLGTFFTRLGEQPANLGKKLGIDGDFHNRASTTLFASASHSALRLVIQCTEQFPEDMAQKLDTYFPDDRIDVFLDMNHDHSSFTRISVMPDGYCEQASYSVRENHLTWDRRHSRTREKLDFTRVCKVNQNGWTLRLDVKLPEKGSDNPSDTPWRIIGLNVVRYRSGNGEEITMWCPDYNRVAAPLYFGDLYLGNPPVTIDSVILGTVCRGMNRGILTFDRNAEGIEIDVTSHNHRELYAEERFRPDGSTCRFSWTLDPRELLNGSLRLYINGMFWGSYDFGWKRGLLLTLDPGVDNNASLSEKPSSGEEDFYWKFCRYILDRLPRFERTQDGLGVKSFGGLFIDLRDAGSALDKL